MTINILIYLKRQYASDKGQKTGGGNASLTFNFGLRPEQLQIYVATNPVDFRRGHDGLAATVQQELGADPFCGSVFVFRSKRGDRIKILFWDGTGLVLLYKRLEGGNFVWPSVRDGIMRLSRGQFEALFEGLDWRRLRATTAKRPRIAS